MALPTALSITNPGAEDDGSEASPPTGWTADVGTWQAESSPNTGGGADAPRTGSYCFSAPSSGSNERLYQDIDLSGESTAIDAGEAELVTTMWLNAYAARNDGSGFVVAFYDVGASLIAPGEIELWGTDEDVGVTDDVWTEATRTIGVPPGARTVRLILTARRFSSGKQSYFDDISMTLQAHGGPFTASDGPKEPHLVNGGMEQINNVDAPNNTPAGWAVVSGAPEQQTTTPAPRTGTYCVWGDGGACEAEQKRHLAAEGFSDTDVDAGDVEVVLSGYASSNDDAGDRARLGIAFYQADGTTQVGSTSYSAWWEAGTAGTWTLRSHSVVAPSGARVVGFRLAGDNHGGGSNATGAWDDVSATIEVVGAAPSVGGRRLVIVGMAM